MCFWDSVLSVCVRPTETQTSGRWPQMTLSQWFGVENYFYEDIENKMFWLSGNIMSFDLLSVYVIVRGVCACTLNTSHAHFFVVFNAVLHMIVCYVRQLYSSSGFCLDMNVEHTRPHSTTGIKKRPATRPLAISLRLAKLCRTSSVSASSRRI